MPICKVAACKADSPKADGSEIARDVVEGDALRRAGGAVWMGRMQLTCAWYSVRGGECVRVYTGRGRGRWHVQGRLAREICVYAVCACTRLASNTTALPAGTFTSMGMRRLPWLAVAAERPTHDRDIASSESFVTRNQTSPKQTSPVPARGRPRFVSEIPPSTTPEL